MLKKAFGESPLLQELLPKATLQLASSLSNDDQEILIYLIGYGRRVMLALGAPSSVCKSPWKPWKYPSKANVREQAFPSWSFSDSCTESSVSIVLAEEALLKRSSWLLGKHKVSSTCDCFSCYSSFWSRWNTSPNRDLMNEILDVIEEGPKSSKGKKKKRADKKRAALGAEACIGKPNGSDENVHHETVNMSQLNQEDLMDIQTSDDPFRSLDSTGKAPVVMKSTVGGTPHPSSMTDEAPKIVTQTLRTGRKKSMFRVTKQKEEARVVTLKSGDLRFNKVSGDTGINDEALLVSGLVGDRATGTEAAVAIEVSVDFTTEAASEVMAVAISPGLLLGKNTPRLHRIGKRRHNQVTPLDCEGLLDVEREQEVAIAVESTQAPMSPRAADIGLGGRGFLARVFPDALGRVASRLWDLVSVRLQSRTVEYH